MELDPFLYHLPKESLRDLVQKPPYECPDYLHPTTNKDGTNVFMGHYSGSLPESYNELWMRHPFYPHISTSNYGRVRRDNSDGSLSALLYREEKDMPGYWVVNDGNYDFFVYSLIAETWLLPWNPDPTKFSIVHHITNNGFVNCPWNLIYVTNAQHSYIHNHLPKGWEDMTEEEAMVSQTKSLKGWLKKVYSKFNLLDSRTYLDLKKSYIKNRPPTTTLSVKAYNIFYTQGFR